jgi:hypothetical protein
MHELQNNNMRTSPATAGNEIASSPCGSCHGQLSQALPTFMAFDLALPSHH